MARLLAVAIAVLLGAACAQRVRTTQTFAGTGTITLASGEWLLVKSPVKVTTDHSIYSGGSGADYDLIRIECAGRVLTLSTMGQPPHQIACGGVTYGPTPAGRILRLEFDAKGDLTIVAIPDPKLVPTPSPSPTK